MDYSKTRNSMTNLWVLSLMCLCLYVVVSKNYKLQVGQSKVQIPAGVRDFSLLRKTSRQVLEPSHLPSQSSLGVKWPVHEIDHWPPYCDEVKNEWSYNSTPPACLSLYAFMVWARTTLPFLSLQQYVTWTKFIILIPHKLLSPYIIWCCSKAGGKKSHSSFPSTGAWISPSWNSLICPVHWISNCGLSLVSCIEIFITTILLLLTL
jgi:hypothetical protein